MNRPSLAPVEAFIRRALLECLQDADPIFWDRRANDFAAVGNERCDVIAEACRNKAAFLRMYQHDTTADEEDLDMILRELEHQAQPRQWRAAA